MKSRMVCLFSALALPCLPFHADAEVGLKVAMDRDPAIYKVGETAHVRVQLFEAGRPVGGKKAICSWNYADSNVVEIAEGGTTIELKLDRPGQVLLRGDLYDGTNRLRGVTADNPKVRSLYIWAGAMFEPEKLRVERTRPADFDAYWEGEVARMKRESPLSSAKAEVREVKSEKMGFRVFDVTIPGLPPRPTCGYLVVPEGAAPKSLPAVAMFQGAGSARAVKEYHAGVMFFCINPHGVGNEAPKAEWKAYFAGDGKNYQYRGWEDRERCFFHGQALRAVRGLEWLKTRPEWNGRDLVVRGVSMGGSQSIQAAALDPDVTLCLPRDPALCDLAGIVSSTHNRSGCPWILYSPRNLPSLQGAKAEVDPVLLANSDYYDSIFFASRIKCPTFVSTGLADDVCFSEGVFKMYNALGGPKDIETVPHAIHCGSSNPRADEALRALTGSCASNAAEPFSAIRLRKPQTDSPKVWQATVEQFRKYRAGVDEVWFSTGICFPKMDEHLANAARLAKASEDVRRLGIKASLQIQATIGHGEAFTSYSDNSGIDWQGYVADDGAEAKRLNCFRAPGFIAYMREMSAAYAAAMRPYSVWIDDDIRIIGHHPDNRASGWGCHCEHCLEVFARKEGKRRTRERLVEEMKGDPELEARWRAFAFEGEAELVRAIADAVHAASPATRMCIQQPGACFPEHRALYEACHAATGLPVGMRPGSGSYFDHDARAQILKAYDLAVQMDTIGDLPFLDRICPEIETCPRSFACRTGRGVLLEALESLSQGMNSISALVIDAGFETPEWYGEEILSAIARNADMLKRYVAANVGARRAGYGVDEIPAQPLQTSSLPLKPLAAGAQTELARIVTGEHAEATIKAGRDAVRRLLDDDLLIDGVAAAALVRAGFGGDVGLSGCRRFPGGLRERFCGSPINDGFLAREAPVSRDAFFLDPADGAKAVGEYFSDTGDSKAKGVAALVFETPSGRRRVVFGHDVFSSSMRVASGDRIVQMHRLADWASHGKSPVVADSPSRSFVQPRVRGDGTLASVVFVNATIGETAPIRLRLRGVSAAVKEATWSALDMEDVKLPVVRHGNEASVTLPRMSAWSGGYLLL